jgi:5'-deoxynucleotidase YfbR-like HD superfamily hydrolase
LGAPVIITYSAENLALDEYRDIFISHSSRDRLDAERLATDLRDAGAKVWFDAWDIGIGDSITKSVETGLSNSKFVGIWITKNAIHSGWVEREWTSRLKEEIEKGHVIVLPLLAEKCELPLFLQDKLYADFTENYSRAFNQLLTTIQVKPRSHGRRILAFTKDILDDLSDEVIPLPLNGKIKIVETLKRMPRSGKYVRLKTYEPKLKIRSVYDHVLSVAYSADCLFPVIEHGIKHHETSEIARCIAFHELSEVILGDIPSFTSISKSKMRSADLYAWKRLKDVDKAQRERVANEFLSLFLGEKERKSLQKVNEYFDDATNPITEFTQVIDKIDPIINVWRYLHFYRGELDQDADNFLRRMKDFFDYPEVKEVAQRYRRDLRIYELVVTLQDRDLARAYYRDRRTIADSGNMFSLPAHDVANLIEGRNMIFVIPRGTGKRRPNKRVGPTEKGLGSSVAGANE